MRSVAKKPGCPSGVTDPFGVSSPVSGSMAWLVISAGSRCATYMTSRPGDMASGDGPPDIGISDWRVSAPLSASMVKTDTLLSSWAATYT